MCLVGRERVLGRDRKKQVFRVEHGVLRAMVAGIELPFLLYVAHIQSFSVNLITHPISINSLPSRHGDISG